MGNYKTGSGNYKSSYLVNIIKQVDEVVNNSDTMQDDDDFKFDGKANHIYTFMIYLFVNLPAASDFKCTWVLPSGASGEHLNGAWSATGDQATTSITNVRSVSTVVGVRNINFLGRIIMGSTSGVCQFQWAQATPIVEDSKLLQGSMLVINEN